MRGGGCGGWRRTDALRRAGLTAFFSQHGDVRSIRLRKHLTSQDFKGSVFLEMRSVEEAQALMDKTLVHEGATLVRRRIASVMRFACVWLTRSVASETGVEGKLHGAQGC
jgi:hypothetical protein